MGGRPAGGPGRMQVVLGIVIPALIAGAAVMQFTTGGGSAGDSGPGALGLAAARISAVPAVGPVSADGDSSEVERIVTGGGAAPVEPGVQPVEDRPAEPTRIVIPDVGVDASIVPVESTDDGIEVPPVYEAGWYEDGPRPSEPGRAIVLGHLDSLDGPAAFTQVPQTQPGSEVTVVDGAGISHTFRVLRTLEVAKSSFPVEEVYGATRRPSLALITCGGDFDPETGYENNVIVFARELRNS